MALYRRRIAADEWKPVGVDALEAAAFHVVRSTDNRSVIAGPGAGKTELLAQRAAYLLQTGALPPPAANPRDLLQTRRRHKPRGPRTPAVPP
jgi:hypothetical protein